MLFMLNNRYLPLTCLLNCSELYSLHPQFIVKFLKYFRNISGNVSRNISRQKIHEILHYHLRMPVTRRAAAFSTRCSVSVCATEMMRQNGVAVINSRYDEGVVFIESMSKDRSSDSSTVVKLHPRNSDPTKR